ncbi:MAG: NUDIX domain-containing protein [Bacteroidota bacterium]
MNAYIARLRSTLGADKLIHPGARIIIENQEGDILFIVRTDTGQLGIPAGSFEEDETIEACIKREVKEETGLTLLDVEVIGISTNPVTETVEYPNKDTVQYFTVEFYSNSWSGELSLNDPAEVKKAQFMNPSNRDRLPNNEQSAFESLEYFRRHNRIMLK